MTLTKLLSALNGYNYHLDAKEKFVENISCLQIKALLQSWIENTKEVRGVKRKYECNFQRLKKKICQIIRQQMITYLIHAF